MASKLVPPASSPSCTVDHRTSRAGLTSAVYLGLKPFGTLLIKPGDAAPPGSVPLEVSKGVYERCNVNERVVEGIRLYDITPRSLEQQHTTSHHTEPASVASANLRDTAVLQHTTDNEAAGSQNATRSPRRRKQIYYFAGGGWQSQATSQHWGLCSHIAEDLTSKGCPTTVSVVSYPLAPNSPSAVALPQLEKLYRALLPTTGSTSGYVADDEEEIIFMGDSAGGNIALALPLHILSTDQSARAPHSLMLISPAVDLRNTNPEMSVVEKDDPMMNVKFVIQTAQAWCGDDMDPSDPRVSPILGDVAVLARRGVKINGVVAGHDVLAPDALLFIKKCQENGVRGKWLHWDKQMHCFPLAYKYKLLKEATEAVDWMVEVIKDEATVS